jgi:hypothetical protein
MSKTPDVAGALEAMKAVVRGPRIKSPVYEWLHARYDPLSAAFAERSPSWKALAKYLADGGIMNADGVAPTPAAVRSSWLRVEADIARRRARRSQRADDPLPTRGRGPVAADPDDEVPDFSSFVKG